jgi:hypothetical protein
LKKIKSLRNKTIELSQKEINYNSSRLISLSLKAKSKEIINKLNRKVIASYRDKNGQPKNWNLQV